MEFVIGATLLEAALLARRGRLAAWAATLGAGFALLVGMRLALAGAAWPWLAACLAASGIAHAIDVLRRA